MYTHVREVHLPDGSIAEGKIRVSTIDFVRSRDKWFFFGPNRNERLGFSNEIVSHSNMTSRRTRLIISVQVGVSPHDRERESDGMTPIPE